LGTLAAIGAGAVQSEGTSNDISGIVNGHVVQARDIGTLNLLPPPVPVPPSWQVLPEDPGFTNRTYELDHLRSVFERVALAPLALMFLLIGPSGVGKTNLSRRFATQVRDRFPDGGYHVCLSDYRTSGGAVDLGAVFGALLIALGVAETAVPATAAARKSMYRGKMRDLKALVVIDDAEFAGQVSVLAPGEHGAVVVTSQRKLPELRGECTVALEVGPLVGPEGVALIVKQIGAERVEAEPGAAAELVELCEGLPVLLRVVCAQLVLRPRRRLSEIAARLRDTAARSQALERAGAFAALDFTYAELPEQAARLYRVLGMMPGTDTSSVALALAIGVTEAETEEGLDDLVEANLVEDIGAGRYSAHAMIRLHSSYLAKRAFSEPEQSTLLRRVVEWYLACGQAADLRLAPVRLRLPGAVGVTVEGQPVPAFADDRAALNWLECEHSALLGCVRIAAAHRWDEVVWSLCDPLWALYQNHKHYAAWTEAFTLAIEAGERAGQRWVCARLRCLLARAYIELAEFDTASTCLEPALALARLEGDRQLEASVLEFTGIVALESGRHTDALELFATARAQLAEGEQTPDAQRADLILRYLTARALTAGGQAGDAVELLEVAYLKAGSSDSRLAGQVRFAWIEALLALGQARQAQDLAAVAVAEAGHRGVPVEQIRALRLLASAFKTAGDHELAAQYQERADALQKGLEASSSAGS
jgi:tetratricopeptide (TPR) repeat protein